MNKDEAIKHFGSKQKYDVANEEIHTLIAELIKASDGFSKQALINAAAIVMVAAMRVDTADKAAALKLVGELWDSRGVAEVEQILAQAMVPVGES